jgi:hypothetical protein
VIQEWRDHLERLNGTSGSMLMGRMLMLVLYSVGTVEVELDVRPPPAFSPPPSPYLPLFPKQSNPSIAFSLYHLIIIHIGKGRMLISERPSLDRTSPHFPTCVDFDGILDVDHHFA